MSEGIRIAFMEGGVLPEDEANELRLAELDTGDGAIHRGTWYSDADGLRPVRDAAGELLYEAYALLESEAKDA